MSALASKAEDAMMANRLQPVDVNVVAYVKGTERYVFVYDDAHRATILSTFGRFAANPSLSLTWYDAACLSQKVRKDTHAT